MGKTNTVVKFYDGTKEVYRDLFNRDGQLFFCYQGAEYKYDTVSTGLIFHSVASSDETPKTIVVVDWMRPRNE